MCFIQFAYTLREAFQEVLLIIIIYGKNTPTEGFGLASLIPVDVILSFEKFDFLYLLALSSDFCWEIWVCYCTSMFLQTAHYNDPCYDLQLPL